MATRAHRSTERDPSGIENLVVPEPAPRQYRSRPRLPEISLLTAILEDAVRCIGAGDRGPSHPEFAEAREWFASEGRRWPFSFENVCDVLEIEPTTLRKRLGVGRLANGS